MGMFIGGGRAWRGDEARENWNGGGTIWSTSSKKDPRFNMNGNSSSISSASAAMDTAIRSKAAKLGISEENIPDDIETSAFKN